MKKLTLTLLLSSALAISTPLALADIVSGYRAFEAGDSARAYDLFLAEAETNPKAAFIVGMMNQQGIMVPADQLEAEKWLVSAANRGSVDALYNLGYFRSKRIFRSNSDDPQGQNSLLAAAEKGHYDAAVLLMIGAFEGFDNGQSLENPEILQRLPDLLEKAFKSGNRLAGFVLGTYWSAQDQLELGEPNYTKAVHYFEKSYHKDFIYPAMALAALYKEGGHGLSVNLEKADHYETIVMNNFFALIDFESNFPGPLSIYGLMTAKEQKALIQRLEKSAKAGFVPAIMELSRRYEVGDGVIKNEAKAAQYLAQLQATGAPEGIFIAGLKLSERQDPQGKVLIEQAASQDYLPAIHWLSESSNHDWNQDASIVASYELQGAKLGDARSIQAVIDRLWRERRDSLSWWSGDEGRPTKVIEEDLFTWVNKQTEVMPNAVKPFVALSQLYRLGIGTTIDLPRAYVHLLTAYNLDAENIDALLMLGRMNAEGSGTPQDYAAATDYYLKARAVSGHQESIEGLIWLYQLTNGFADNLSAAKALLGDTSPAISGDTVAMSIQNQLLDELAAKIADNPDQGGIYGYLLGDRYHHLYMDAMNAGKSVAEADPLREKAIAYYMGGIGRSDQSKLHYAESLLQWHEIDTKHNNDRKTDSKTVTHIDDTENADDAHDNDESENLVSAFETATKALMGIDSLIPNAQYRSNDLYERTHLNLNDEETTQALDLIFEILAESDELQKWVGRSVMIDNPEVIERMKVLSDQAVPFAQYYYGQALLLASNFTDAYPLIENAGKADYLPAIGYLASEYQKGNQALLDVLGGTPLTAIDWYQKGVELKDDWLIYNLADIYKDEYFDIGLNYAESQRLAIAYYEQLQDPDYRFAKSHLRDARERLEKYEAYEKSLANNEPEAIYKKAQNYHYGSQGFTKDEAKAVEFYIKAADLGYVPAMKEYYSIHLDDKAITGETLARFNRYAIEIVEQEQRDWDIQRLADRYLAGDRIEENREKARALYQRALTLDPSSSASYDMGYLNRFDNNLPLAKKGNVEAMLIIARAYGNGNGIRENQEESFKWMEKAAKGGNLDAAFYYGVDLQEGVINDDGSVIIAPNWEEAVKWFAVSNPRFKNAISSRMEEYEQEYLPAMKGDSEAMLALGKRQADRYNSRQNPYYLKEARAWYQKSLDAGNMNAHLGLIKLLPEAERASYLSGIMQVEGNAAFKVAIAKQLLGNSNGTSTSNDNNGDNLLTQDDIEMLLQNLESVIADPQNAENLRLEAAEQLLEIYRKGIQGSQGQIIFKADPERYRERSLHFGETFPRFKRIMGTNLLKQEDPESVAEGLVLLEEAFNAGDHYAAVRLYGYYMPGHYDTATQAQVEGMTYWLGQYLKQAPAFPSSPYQYSEIAHLDEILDNSDRGDYSQKIAELWSKRGYDFMPDPRLAKQWYETALQYTVNRDIVTALRDIAEKEYDKTQDQDALKRIYQYAIVYDQLAAVNSNHYNYEQLSAEDKQSARAAAHEIQDLRDYGARRWVVDERLKSAEKGDVIAMLGLGNDYLYGQDIRKNVDTAIYYYEMAGEGGNADAYNRLGNLFRKGEEITADYPRAVAYFEKGAALGDSNTAHLAGDMHYFGTGGIPKDYEKAAAFYEMTDLAQGNHHALAKFKQAEILYQGLIRPATIEDYQKAHTLLLLGLEYGEKRAVEALATWDFSILYDAKNQP